MSDQFEHGFTLLEVLVAGAVVTLMGLTGLVACKAAAGLVGAAYTAGRDAGAIDRQAGKLRDDAAAASAVFVPPTDMHGAPNDGPAAHEIDFYARGDGGSDLLWRYFYDSAKKTLRRYDYEPNGLSGVRDVATGHIDGTAAYPPLRGVTAFGPRSLPADQLVDPARNRYAAIGALFDGTPRALGISYDHSGLDIPQAIGGNAVVEVVLANGAAARVVHLVPGALPAGFTVTGAAVWHAIVYRVDQTHRFLFGFAGKSHVFIRARVDVSYDGWQSRSTWCDFNLFGEPGGLDPHDPHADYKPAEPEEQAESILARCRQSYPAPPPRGSAGNAPEPGTLAPLPGPTPPSCWTDPGPGGPCWPADAPPDWQPPSPFPAAPPPAQWCRTHAGSPVCPPTGTRPAAGETPAPAS